MLYSDNVAAFNLFRQLLRRCSSVGRASFKGEKLYTTRRYVGSILGAKAQGGRKNILAAPSVAVVRALLGK